jgi:hypothetical protein
VLRAGPLAARRVGALDRAALLPRRALEAAPEPPVGSGGAAASLDEPSDVARRVRLLAERRERNLIETLAEEIEDFETVWRISGRRPPDTVPATCLEPRTLDYAAMGRFREQVERYLSAFPPEQVRAICFRDWIANPRSTYLEILEFLGLEDDGRTEFLPINQGMTYRSRDLARFILYPPNLVRSIVQLAKTLTGSLGRSLERKARKTGLQTTIGYRQEISPELRDEVRRYYAEDNRLLEERLRRAGFLEKG